MTPSDNVKRYNPTGVKPVMELWANGEWVTYTSYSALKLERDALYALLTKWQHSGISDTGGGDFCLSCMLYEPLHAEDCEIGNALKRPA